MARDLPNNMTRHSREAAMKKAMDWASAEEIGARTSNGPTGMIPPVNKWSVKHTKSK